MMRKVRSAVHICIFLTHISSHIEASSLASRLRSVNYFKVFVSCLCDIKTDRDNVQRLFHTVFDLVFDTVESRLSQRQ